jgi:hypothetical protein
MSSDRPVQLATAVPQKPSQRLLEVLLIVLVFFLATGDPLPNVNETDYVCKLKHYWNPEWCKGDLFLESADTQIAFIWTFGWLTRFASLSVTAWIGRTVAWFFTAWAWQRLSWRIAPRPFMAVLSATLFLALNYYGQVAAEWVVGGVEAKCFAYAFVLAALRELIDRRWNMVCLTLGAAIAFHPIVGGWSALVCAAIWILVGRREQNFLAMSPGIIGGALLAIVGLAPVLSLTWHEQAELVDEANRIYVFERLPHHLSILTMPESAVVLRLTRFVGLLALIWLVSRAIPRQFGARRLVLFAWGAALLAIAGLAIELALYNQPLMAARLLKYYWLRLTDFAAPMAVSLLAVAVIDSLLQKRRNWGRVIVFLAVMLSVAYVIDAQRLWIISNFAGEPPVPPADVKLTDYPRWVDACEWIAANTPPDALFLTPRLNQSFKWRTGRPEVANWKDMPQDAAGIVAWYRRLKDIYYTKIEGAERTLDSLGELGTEKVRELSIKYHAPFVLADRSQLLSLPIAYSNEEYIVYRIENRSTGYGR